MRVALVALVIFLSIPLAASGDQHAPQGMVMLTIGGAIDNANRDPSDAKRDEFLSYHQLSFINGFELDRAMLEALPQQELTVQPPETEAPARYEGPLLKEVLALAGARRGVVTLRALDGYATELSAEEVEGSDWILALKADGKPLGIGQQGPI
jgi:hypothetical protein